MIVTERTRHLLREQRSAKKLIASGYEEVGEKGGKLWQIYRGARIGQLITDAVVSPNGMSVYVKIEARP